MCLVVFSRVLTLKVHCLYIPCAVRGAYAIKRGEVNFVAVVDKAYTCCLQALLKTTDGAGGLGGGAILYPTYAIQLSRRGAASHQPTWV